MRFLALMLLSFAAHASPPALVWSPTDHSQFVAVSGTNLTRTNIPFGGAWMSARSDTSQSVGVRTVEIRVDQVGSGVMLGVANGAADSNASLGANANSIGYWSIGNTLKNGTWGGVMPPSFTSGDSIGVEVNFDARTVRFRKNSGVWSAPLDTNSLGPDVYVAVSLGQNAPPTAITVTADDWNDYQYPTDNVVAVGDSITMGGVLQPYLPRLLKIIRDNRVGYAQGAKLGISGVTWQFAWSAAGYPYSLIQDAPIRVDPLRHAYLPNWLILFAGTNGFAIFHDTPAHQCADAQTYVSQRIAAGWQANRILVNAMLPRMGVTESDRSLYNACQEAMCTTIGCKFVHLELTSIGAAGDNLDSAKYMDGIHPTNVSHGVIAEANFSVMFP